MSNLKHFNYKSTLLAIVFGFLNCVCMASPVLKANADCNQELVSLQFGNDLNNIDIEADPISAYSFKINQVNFAAAKFSSHPNPYTDIATNGFISKPLASNFSAYLIPEPGYYSFLFQYSLF
jgi:hypothetical protein